MKLLRSIPLVSLGFMLALAVAGAAQAAPPSWAPGPPPWAGGPKNNDRPTPTIPEPTGALLFGAGLAATMVVSRRRKTH